jgi:elongator complex protein 1
LGESIPNESRRMLIYSAYSLANKLEKALKAYEKAHAWRDLFTLAVQQKMPRQAIVDMCERVTDYLSSRGRHLEAAQVFIEYTQDVDSAVDMLCRGSEFGEAYRLVSGLTRGLGRADWVDRAA